MLRSSVVWLSIGCGLVSQPGFALFLDGDGHYSLLGETQTRPGFTGTTATLQAVRQSFRLQGEARLNEKSSVLLEFRLFDRPREAYLGDTARPQECSPRHLDGSLETTDSCEGRNQSPADPGYEPYVPKITEAYVQYAFEYCLIEAGRRGRDWGIGAFLDSGRDPFDFAASIYDGFTCDVNVQKTQTIGFSAGYDKLAETGGLQVNPLDYPATDPANPPRRSVDLTEYGATNKGDDLDQIFAAIEMDDRRANAGSGFTKHIGFYLANILGSGTDVKLVDFYSGFYLQDIVLQNEIIARLGKSDSQSWAQYGGTRSASEDSVQTNKLEALALAGKLDFTIQRSGAHLGPKTYHRGDAERHAVLLEWAYTPGDSDGYYRSSLALRRMCENRAQATESDASQRANAVLECLGEGSASGGLGDSRRSDGGNAASALALHRNYRVAKLLFSGPPNIDFLKVDGVFDPGRVMNATVLAAGYKYESIEFGNITAKLVHAFLNTKIPDDVRDLYANHSLTAAQKSEVNARADRPIGFAGTSLGWELDIDYRYNVGQEVELVAALAAALPGDAWKVKTDANGALDTLQPSYLIQAGATFRF